MFLLILFGLVLVVLFTLVGSWVMCQMGINDYKLYMKHRVRELKDRGVNNDEAMEQAYTEWTKTLSGEATRLKLVGYKHREDIQRVSR